MGPSKKNTQVGFIPFRNKKFLDERAKEEGRRTVIAEFEPVLIENRKQPAPESIVFIFPPKKEAGWQETELGAGHLFNKWRAHVEYGGPVPVLKGMGSQSTYKLLTMASLVRETCEKEGLPEFCLYPHMGQGVDGGNRFELVKL